MVFVLNASPLIVLAKADLLQRILALPEKFFIPQATAVLDDLAARRCAMALGLSVTGTLGLLLEAKKRGHINAVSPALNAIVAAGLYISRHHLDAIREKAGEM